MTAVNAVAVPATSLGTPPRRPPSGSWRSVARGCCSGIWDEDALALRRSGRADMESIAAQTFKADQSDDGETRVCVCVCGCLRERARRPPAFLFRRPGDVVLAYCAAGILTNPIVSETLFQTVLKRCRGAARRALANKRLETCSPHAPRRTRRVTELGQNRRTCACEGIGGVLVALRRQNRQELAGVRPSLAGIGSFFSESSQLDLVKTWPMLVEFGVQGPEIAPKMPPRELFDHLSRFCLTSHLMGSTLARILRAFVRDARRAAWDLVFSIC